MKETIYQFFKWSKTQRLVIIILFSLALISSTLPCFLQDNATPITIDEALTLRLQNASNKPDQILEDTLQTSNTLTYFDPNEADMATWESMGVETKIADRIIRYRNKNGRFYKPKDLKKIYDFPEKTYNKIKPFIKINPLLTNPNYVTNKNHITQNQLVNINTEDGKAWEALKGIGEKISLRILKYKLLLGGFYSIEQIKEVYGISDSLYSAVKKYLIYTPSTLTLIHINSATLVELGKHPYIGFNLAKKILQYKQKTGAIKSIDELIQQQILQAEQAEKIKNYITFDILAQKN